MRIKFSVEFEKLKSIIHEILEYGNPYVKGGKLFFRGEEERNVVTPYRLCHMIFYAKETEYYDVAFDILRNADYICIFGAVEVAYILLNYGDILPDDCKENITDMLQAICLRGEYLENTEDFIGVNDNFPLLATYTCFAMEKIFGYSVYRHTAKQRLKQLKKLLCRRGSISEYNSQNYTPIQLYILSLIYEIARLEEDKTIAQNAMDRIWFDLLCHFNPATGDVSGPFSRDYMIARSNYELEALPAIYNLLNPDIQLELPDYKTANIELVCYLICDFYCDEKILDLVKNKKYPFVYMATSEHSASTDATPEIGDGDITKQNEIYEYSAGVTGMYTYQTKYYSVGWATDDWHNGVQCTSPAVEYKRVDKPEKFGDHRIIFSRYLLNDETNENQAFMDQGRKMAFGDKNKAVVLYKPKSTSIKPEHTEQPFDALALNYRSQEITGNLGVESAKLAIMIPLHGQEVDKIILGSEQANNSKEIKSVYIKDGDVYIAIHPLFVTDLGRENAMEIKQRDGFLEIDLINYKGSRKDFSRREFILSRNGYMISVSSKEEISSFEEFVEKESKTKIKEDYLVSVHSRMTYVRKVEIEHPDVSLSCEYSPSTEGIKHISKGDYAINIPKLYASDFDVSCLPYCEDLK